MPPKSKDEPASEKKPEIKKEPQNVTGTVTTNKKQGKKGTVFRYIINALITPLLSTSGHVLTFF